MLAKPPDTWSYLPAVLLIVVLFVALTWAYRVWVETHENEEPVTDKELLAEFEKAYFAGELDDNELQRVRALLGFSNAAWLENRAKPHLPGQEDLPPPVGDLAPPRTHDVPPPPA